MGWRTVAFPFMHGLRLIANPLLASLEVALGVKAICGTSGSSAAKLTAANKGAWPLTLDNGNDGNNVKRNYLNVIATYLNSENFIKHNVIISGGLNLLYSLFSWPLILFNDKGEKLVIGATAIPNNGVLRRCYNFLKRSSPVIIVIAVIWNLFGCIVATFVQFRNWKDADAMRWLLMIRYLWNLLFVVLNCIL